LVFEGISLARKGSMDFNESMLENMLDKNPRENEKSVEVSRREEVIENFSKNSDLRNISTEKKSH